MSENTVTISKEEYDELISAQNLLNALISAGVDNWEGYDMAVELAEDGD